MPIKIIKSTGKKETFDPEKILRSCVRAGVSKELCEKVVEEISAKVKEEMSTEKILEMVKEILEKKEPAAAARYGLREAIFALGPAGYYFEKYVGTVFSEHGYDTELPELLEGECIKHEVDLISKRNGRTFFVECKFRLSKDIFISVKDTLATWARFLDLISGSALGKCPHFDECWIVTNAKFSNDSLKYGHCKNMVLLGWNHPKEKPFPSWIDEVGLYPITLLKLTEEETKKLIKSGFILLKDLLTVDTLAIQRTGLGPRFSDLANQAREILSPFLSK